MVIRRAISLYLALVAVAVTAQFTLWRVYSPASGSARAASDAIWNVLGWCQLAGLALTLAVTHRQKRSLDADPASSRRRWLTANLLFYSALLLALAFLPIWLAAGWGDPPPEDTFWLVWYVINTAGPVIFAVTALRIRQGADG